MAEDVVEEELRDVIKTEKKDIKFDKRLLIPETIDENYDSYSFRSTMFEDEKSIFGMNRHKSAIIYSTPEHTMELLRQTSAAIEIKS